MTQAPFLPTASGEAGSTQQTVLYLKELFRRGQVFAAFNQIQSALEEASSQDPFYWFLPQYKALALLRTGSLMEARAQIDPLLDQLTVRGQILRQALQALKGEAALKVCQELQLPLSLPQPGLSLYEEASGIFYQLWRERWLFLASGGQPGEGMTEDLRLAQLLALEYYSQVPSPQSAAKVALYSWILGDDLLAQYLAQQICNLPPEVLTHSYEVREAHLYSLLLLGKGEAALEVLQMALGQTVDKSFSQHLETRQHLQLLSQLGLSIPAGVMAALQPPVVVVFTGHPLDLSHQEAPRFPATLEGPVRTEIEAQLTHLGAQVGYCMGTVGSDLLFAEAMLARGGEINLVLPCALEDFIQTSVAYGGPRWERRFRAVLDQAATVTYATEQNLLGQQMLYRFGNQVLHGVAEMRAEYFETEPHLLAVWDHKTGSLPGGAADFIDQWDSISTLHLIDLDAIYTTHFGAAPNPSAPSLVLPSSESLLHTYERQVKSFLFSDLAGYSQLQDAHIPRFLRLMEDVAAHVRTAGIEVNTLNTWGDAIFAVTDRALDLALFALSLQEAVAQHGRHPDLARPLEARISLHAGPVFTTLDAFTGQANYFGNHVNRAARLEPVTINGQVFATQQFVALLQAERAVLETQKTLPPIAKRLGHRYVGRLELAKHFGTQPIYQLLLKPALPLS